MLRALVSAWESAFLEERSSASLGLFRIAVALTVGLHVIPTLLHMGDNYLSTAFREQNASFFPPGVLAWVDGHSDRVVWTATGCFLLSWLSLLLGFLTQAATIGTLLSCYYLYARNSVHIGTLSWDILLVTLFLMAVTSYPGDRFSLDRRLRPAAVLDRRPIFLQRLLQLQLASTFFYTGLNKWTAGGNWVTDNPFYYLMHAPATGIMKEFPGRAFLAARPELCWQLGIACIVFEMTLPVWLFWRRTRPWAVAAGIAFHFWLLFTMHVPTIFFFLFPPMFLLFVDPEWVEERLGRRLAASTAPEVSAAA